MWKKSAEFSSVKELVRIKMFAGFVFVRLLAAVICVGITVGSPAFSDWGHSTLWDQLSAGADNSATASWADNDSPSDAQAADDFVCTQNSWITSIRFTGWSTYGDEFIDKFRVSFWSDVPATGSDASHPRTQLWTQDFSRADSNDPIKLGWYPISDTDYMITVPLQNWFLAQGTSAVPTVYWVSIQALMVTDGYEDSFYWQFKLRNVAGSSGDAAIESTSFNFAPWANWACPQGYGDPGTPYIGLRPSGSTGLDMAFALSGTSTAQSLTVHVTLENFSGDITTVPITVEMRLQGGSTNTILVYPNSSGNITVPVPQPGTYDLTFDAGHWLKKLVYSVVNGQNVSLTNGDVDGNGEVTTTDLSVVLKNMGKTGN